MAKYTWVKDTVPNKPGIWIHGGLNPSLTSRWSIIWVNEAGIASNAYSLGWWCFVCDTPEPEMPEKPWEPVKAILSGATMKLVNPDEYDLSHVIVTDFNVVPESGAGYTRTYAFAAVYRKIGTLRPVFVDSIGCAGDYLFAKRK